MISEQTNPVNSNISQSLSDPRFTEKMNRYQQRKFPWLRKFLFLIGPFRCRFLMLAAGGFVLNILTGVANPLVIKVLFDEGILKGRFSWFVGMAVLSVAMFTLLRFIRLVYGLALERWKNHLLNRHILHQTLSYYRLPVLYLTTRSEGYFIQRVYDDVVATVPPLVESILESLNAIVLVLSSLTVSFWLSPRITILLLFILPPLIFLSRRFGAHIAEKSRDEKEVEALFRGTLSQSLQAWKTVRLFGMLGAATASVRKSLTAYILASYRRFREAETYQTLSGIMGSAAETTVLIAGGYEILRARMTFGGFMAFMNAFWYALGGFAALIQEIPRLARGLGMLDRLMEFDTLVEEIPRVYRGNHLEFHGVELGWPPRVVLHNVESAVPQGARVLIQGPNGSGKTTLVHAAAGMLPPLKGTIFTLPAERISAILSPLSFLPGTIQEQIDYLTTDEMSKIKFFDLVRAVGLDDLMNRSPHDLSTGQKKRFEIVLGLVRDADLYIFDEPFSGIHENDRDTLLDLIFRNTEGRTLLIVMHDAELYRQKFDLIWNVNMNSVHTYYLHKRENVKKSKHVLIRQGVGGS